MRFLPRDRERTARWGPSCSPFRPPRLEWRGTNPRDSFSLRSPADIEEADRIFDRTLAGIPQPVRPTHRTPPALPRQAAPAGAAAAHREGVRESDAGAPHARRGRRDDPHGHARSRRRARRGRAAAARPDRQRRLGQQGQHPARRHALHARLPPDEHGGPAVPAKSSARRRTASAPANCGRSRERGNLRARPRPTTSRSSTARPRH